MYLLDFLDGGLLNLSWWQSIVALLLLTHVTIAAVTSSFIAARRTARWTCIRP